jgi:hypothetical protein
MIAGTGVASSFAGTSRAGEGPLARRQAYEWIDEPDRPTADAIGEPPRTGCVGGEARPATMAAL